MFRGRFDTGGRLLRVKAAVRRSHSGRQSRPHTGIITGLYSGAVNREFLFSGAVQEYEPEIQKNIRCWRLFYGF